VPSRITARRRDEESDLSVTVTKKRLLAIALCALLAAASLAACDKSKDGEGNRKVSVITTIFAPYDFTRAVAGGRADIAMLLSPGSEAHSFEPTPQDIIRIQNCDVFICVGGKSDSWVNGILASMDTSNMGIIALMDCVNVVEEEIVKGMQDDGAEDGEEPERDEHVWTSPRNAKLIVERISGALCEADPVNADAYRQNTAAYLAELTELDARLSDTVAAAARRTIVFGDRFPFRYFADAYGLTYFAAFPGCSNETEASAKTVAFLVDEVRSEKIPVIFHIELSNRKMANAISEATGAKVKLLHACHNITKADFEAGKTYLDFMSDNVEALKEALS